MRGLITTSPPAGVVLAGGGGGKPKGEKGGHPCISAVIVGIRTLSGRASGM